MSELFLGLLGTLGLGMAVFYSMLCWFGGRDQNYLGIRARIWGRYIAPVSLATCAIGLSLLSHRFSFWYLLSYPAYIGSHTFGYGGDKLWVKILRRSLWSIVRTGASLAFAIPAGALKLYALQAVLGLIATLVLGIMNPLKAPQEEGLINFTNVFMVPFMVL